MCVEMCSAKVLRGGVLSFANKRKNQRKLPLLRRSGPAPWGLHAPKTPKEEVARPSGYANAVLLFALNAYGPCSTLNSGVRGCERGPTVERSEIGERAMLAPAGQATARAGQLCWLAALVVRRQAPRTPAGGNGMSVGAGLCSARAVRGGRQPSLAPLVFPLRLRRAACPHAAAPCLYCPLPR